MGYKIQDIDVEILRKTGVSKDDIRHCVKVAEKALEIADRIENFSGIKLDVEFVGRGALFHDLGKAKTHGIEHGKVGAEIGKALGLPGEITVLERFS